MKPLRFRFITAPKSVELGLGMVKHLIPQPYIFFCNKSTSSNHNYLTVVVKGVYG